MNSVDKARIIKRYNDRLQKFGPSIDALASGTDERRALRFKTLMDLGISDGASVLDLGCGFGDLIPFLKEANVQVDYTGYDINPNLVEVAQKRFPDKRIETKDILNDDFPTFDYIISTSCFNLPLTETDNYDFIFRIMNTCYNHASKGVAIDLLSSYVDFESKEGFHYKPEKIFALAKKITKRVCLRHDYPLFEFCVYLYKDFEGWGEK